MDAIEQIDVSLFHIHTFQVVTYTDKCFIQFGDFPRPTF